MTTAFLYPGQGAQYVGMGKDFYERFSVARSAFDTADRVLARPLTQIIFHGPAEVLSQTENTQSAMLSVCVAITRLLQEAGVCATHAAGLSLGEYAALVAAGALSYEEALLLVEDRARFMQEAVPQGVGGMTAILGLDEAGVEEAVAHGRDFGKTYIANYNAPGQIVLTGEAAGLSAAAKKAKELGARRCMPLDVSAPFHSPMLAPAKEKLEARLAEISFSTPALRVYANVDAKPIPTAGAIADLLGRQVTGSIYFQQSIEAMLKEGVTQFVEIGPGKALTGFVKRIAKEAGLAPRLVNLQTAEDFERFINEEKGARS